MANEHLKEAESRILKLKPKTFRWDMTDYIGAGTSTFKFLNVKIPKVRAEFKKGFSFSNLDPNAQWKTYDYIWKNSSIFEVVILASYWAGSRPVEELCKFRKILLSWIERVDNWGLSDELSSHYSKLLEHSPSDILPIFKKWNASSEPWKKRQSMVGLLFYSRMRKRRLSAKVILGSVSKHLDDEHYYVQKGVGWTLRECWNVYPKETFNYLKLNAGRIPPAGWTAATEKLPLSSKVQLKAIRKKQRSSGD